MNFNQLQTAENGCDGGDDTVNSVNDDVSSCVLMMLKKTAEE